MQELTILSAIVLLIGVQNKPATMQIDVHVAGAAYTFSGSGECHATDDASIFSTPAGMKSARHDEATRSLNLTLWRIAKGGESITLDVEVAGKRHRVNTLPVGPVVNRRGSGGATYQSRGAGGVFTIDATADTGARITGSIRCSSFAKPEENG